ncbi:MAG: PaREP1 family protein [Pyrobaculum sp.]
MKPEDELETYRRLAKRFLEEGSVIDNDPIQASEKFYKAAEGAAAVIHNFRAVLDRVAKRGRWSAADLRGVARFLAKKHGDDVWRWWSAAWYLLGDFMKQN